MDLLRQISLINENVLKPEKLCLNDINTIECISKRIMHNKEKIDLKHKFCLTEYLYAFTDYLADLSDYLERLRTAIVNSDNSLIKNYRNLVFKLVNRY